MTRITDALPRWVLVLALHALPAAAAPAPEALWQLIGKLATASTQGGQAVLGQWPGRPFSLTGAGDISSAPFMLGPGLQSTIAEVRLAEGDAVQLMVLELQGSCITPADIAARYAQVRNADFPQPNNPDPVSYRRVEIDGVRVSFGFRGALPGCLTHVVFNPQAH
ncbi:MAG: hypothetical protein RR311_04085 [Comamonas sp.]